VARDSITVEQTLSLLEAAPQRIAELTAGLTPAQLRTAPGPDEWSATEVLAHMRACADQWGGSIVAMLTADHPTLRAINPRSWIKQTDYPELEFQPSFRAFATQRAELLALLEPLPPASWSRGATMTGAGAPLERTVLSQSQRLAIHERPHIKQIASIVKALQG
jgi:hypothetical protein